MQTLDTSSPYDDMFTSIEDRSSSRLSSSIRNVRDSGLRLNTGILLRRCIHAQWQAGFQICLQASDHLDAKVAEAAARSSVPSFLLAILEHGWPINESLKNGTIPSVLSIALHDEDQVAALLARGADPNARSSIAETPLSFAVRSGSLKAIHALISAGGDVSIGDTLHCAVQRERSDTREVISLLVSHGAPVENIQFEDPRARQLRGHLKRGTALHLACRLHNREAVSTLLLHGANPLATRRYCNQPEHTTPLDIARAVGDKEIENLLEAALKV